MFSGATARGGPGPAGAAAPWRPTLGRDGMPIAYTTIDLGHGRDERHIIRL